MQNLFSTFDPATLWFNLRLNWLSLACILFIPSIYWIASCKFFFLFKGMFKFLFLELKSVLYIGTPSSIFLVLLSFLLYIFINNFLGLLPYVFTSTRHLSVTLALALPLWRGYLIVNRVANPRRTLAHLVPKGTPLALIPFIVLIELVRNFIRPLTLSVRLAANIVAGHLLLVLVRGPMPLIAWHVFSGAFLGLITLIVLEVGVSFIQAYVFMTLSSLYIAEVNNPNN